MKEQDAAYSFPNTPKFPEKNWEEDYMHENGMYQNRCLECKELFFGHKSRRVCKECFNKPIDWEKMALKQPPKEIKNNAWPGCWADGEMTGFARCTVKKVKPLEAELTRLRSELKQAKHDNECLKDLLLKEQIKHSDKDYTVIKNDELDRLTSKLNQLMSELQQERELRKELVNCLEVHQTKWISADHYWGSDTNEWAETLIAKAKFN